MLQFPIRVSVLPNSAIDYLFRLVRLGLGTMAAKSYRAIFYASGQGPPNIYQKSDTMKMLANRNKPFLKKFESDLFDNTYSPMRQTCTSADRYRNRQAVAYTHELTSAGSDVADSLGYDHMTTKTGLARSGRGA